MDFDDNVRTQADGIQRQPLLRPVEVPLALVALLLLLFVVPARFVVPGFGAAGAPASLLGLGLLGLLILSALHREPLGIRLSPILIGLGVYFCVALAAYAHAHSQALTPLASSTSDRAMISLVSLVGITLFVISRIRTAAMVARVVDVTVAISMAMCVVGLIQFFTGTDVTQYLRVPGLVLNNPDFVSEVETRSIFNRPAGTALHPIEFGVVTASLVPLSIARAIQTRATWMRVAVVVLAFSAMTSVSRSAVLALVVMFVCLLAGLGWRQRANLAIGAVVFVIGAGSIVPGLVGTLRSLFSNTENDPSVQARLDRTPRVLELISEFRWFGRGYGVFTPSEYLLLDNEVQKLAIELGVLGISILALWVISIVWTAVNAGQNDGEWRVLTYALLGSVMSILMSSYTFDAFFYHILTGVLYLSLGLLSVLWSVRNDDGDGVATYIDSRPDEEPVSTPIHLRPESGRPLSTTPSSRPDHGGRERGSAVPVSGFRQSSILVELGLAEDGAGRPADESDTPPHGLFGDDWPDVVRDDHPSDLRGRARGRNDHDEHHRPPPASSGE